MAMLAAPSSIPAVSPQQSLCFHAIGPAHRASACAKLKLRSLNNVPHNTKRCPRHTVASATSSESSPGDNQSKNADSLDKSLSKTKKKKRSNLPPEWEALTKPVPEPPNYLLLAAGFSLVYFTRYAIAAELLRWISAAAIVGLTAIHFTKRLITACFYKAVHAMRGPLAVILTSIGWAGVFVQDTYKLIVKNTSVGPTLQALLLVTLILSLGEASRSKSVSGQPLAFLVATFLGIGVVSGIIHPIIYVLLLLVFVGVSLLVQKKDPVSAVLPVSALLVGLADLPLKVVAFVTLLALSVYTHWKNPEDHVEHTLNKRKIIQPAIMVIVAFLLGLTVGSRYLHTCRLLWLAK